MASNRFRLGKCLYKSIDGKGKVYEAFISPAAQVMASRMGKGDAAESGLYMAYYSAKYNGIIGDMGFDAGDNDEEAMIDFFSKFSFVIEDLTDDGNPVSDGEDENPTDAS